MRVLGFHHLALKVLDVERVAAFYGELLGLPERARHHRPDGSLRSIWLDVPLAGFLAIEQHEHEARPDPAAEWPGWYLLALRIEASERDRVEAELTARGIAIVHRTKWSLYFRDPEGNRVALSHHPDDAP